MKKGTNHQWFSLNALLSFSQNDSVNKGQFSKVTVAAPSTTVINTVIIITLFHLVEVFFVVSVALLFIFSLCSLRLFFLCAADIYMSEKRVP